jgi:hypothetical protein
MLGLPTTTNNTINATTITTTTITTTTNITATTTTITTTTNQYYYCYYDHHYYTTTNITTAATTSTPTTNTVATATIKAPAGLNDIRRCVFSHCSPKGYRAAASRAAQKSLISVAKTDFIYSLFDIINKIKSDKALPMQLSLAR